MAEQQKAINLPEMKLLEAALAKSLGNEQSPFKLPDVKPMDVSRFAQNLSKIAERSQHLLQIYLEKQLKGEVPFSIPDPGIVAKAFIEMTQRMLTDPNKLIQAQINFWQDYVNMWQIASQRMLGQEIQPAVAADSSDKRFKDTEWTENVIFDFIKQILCFNYSLIIIFFLLRTRQHFIKHFPCSSIIVFPDQRTCIIKIEHSEIWIKSYCFFIFNNCCFIICP